MDESARAALSLLSLDPDGETVDLYRLLGLRFGESDPAKIAAALQDRARLLSHAKSKANPEAWKKATQWVALARQTLSDPARKQQYDRKRGVASESVAATGREPIRPQHDRPQHDRPRDDKPRDDGLAAAIRVPGSDPMAGFLPNASPSDESLPRLGQGKSVTDRHRGRRRRTPHLALLFLTVLVIASFAAVATTLYVLTHYDSLQITVGPKAAPSGTLNGRGEIVASPGPERDRAPEPWDPVMGRILGPGRSPLAFPELPENDELSVEVTDRDTNDDPTLLNQRINSANSSDPKPSSESPPAMLGEVRSAEPTAEELAIADAAIFAAAEALRSANWEQMLGLTDAAIEHSQTNSQRSIASRYRDLADLATYYQEGIIEALTMLGAGEQINLTDQMQVGIVEANRERLIIRVNGRNKEYAFREIPLLIIHQLARFSMPSDAPTTQAAGWVYQAIAPITTADYRERALTELERMDGDDEIGDPRQLAATIRELFGA